jgi:hypothetical protein
MKIIDLLNKIAKGEEVPKKIIVYGEISDDIFTFNKNADVYYDDDCNTLGYKYNLEVMLDSEIEIIEEVEDKEYEDIEETTGDYIVPNTPATENEAYIMACLIAHEQTINALIRNQQKIIERMKRDE